MLHIPPTHLLLLAARKVQKNRPAGRVTGLGRKTRQEMVKWNQMIDLRFKTGGRHETSLASLRAVSRTFIAKLTIRQIIGFPASPQAVSRTFIANNQTDDRFQMSSPQVKCSVDGYLVFNAQSITILSGQNKN